jgi:glycerophosphoryl diester phosphodiesterase
MRIAAASIIILAIANVASATEACAHRGDVEHAPENTIPALLAAVDKGAKQIEFDVALTSDKHLILMHDVTVDRTTNGTGKPDDLTFAAIRALDAGSWFDPRFEGTRVPTLEEALSAIPETILCNVHLKGGPELAKAAAEEIARLGRLDQCFLACTIEQIDAARSVVPNIETCNMSRQTGDRAAYIADTIEMNCEYIQLHQRDGYENLREEVRQLHTAGVTVNWFGANDAALMRMLVEAGVDYILTDKLSLCIEETIEENR